MSKKVLYLLVVLSIVMQSIPVMNNEASAALNPSTGWQYCKQITITNAVTNYQLRIHLVNSNGVDSGNTIYVGAYSQNFPFDIRFGTTNNPSNATQLPQWLESYNSTDAYYWVNISSYSTIYLFTGNSGASEYSDGDATFIFFDDFDTLNTSIWVTSGNVSVRSGSSEITVNGDASGDASAKTTLNFSYNTAVLSKWKYTYLASYGATGVGFNIISDDDAVISNAYGGATYFRLRSKKAGSILNVDTTLSKAQDEYHIFDVIRNGTTETKMRLDYEYNASTTDTTYIPTGVYPVSLRARGGSSNYYSTLVVDWVAVRKYAYPDPTISTRRWQSVSGGWTNTPPTISNENPSDGATGVQLQPTVSVYIGDADGNSSVVDFYISTDNSTWTHAVNFPSVLNQTVSYNYTSANQYNTTYYWKVTANDSHDNVSAIYSFTTTVIYPPTISNPIPENESIWVWPHPTVSVYISDTDGSNSTVDFYISNDGTNWTHVQHNTSILNEIVSYNYTSANQYNTTYYWKVTANDTYYNVSAIYHFTTTPINRGLYFSFDNHINEINHYFYWSGDNGSSWQSRYVIDGEAYGVWEWFNKTFAIAIYSGQGSTAEWAGISNQIYVFWTDTDAVMNNTGWYSTTQTLNDTPVYSFPISRSDVNSSDIIDGYTLARGIELHNDTVYIVCRNTTGGIHLLWKKLGTSSWNTSVLKDGSEWYPIDIARVHDGYYVILAYKYNGTDFQWYYAYTQTPTNNSSWVWNTLNSKIWTNGGDFTSIPGKGAIETFDDGKLVVFVFHSPWHSCPVDTNGNLPDNVFISVIDDRNGSTTLGTPSTVDNNIYNFTPENYTACGGKIRHPVEYDSTRNLLYLAYFDYTNQTDVTHLCIKSYNLSTGVWGPKQQFPNSGDTIVGESWNNNQNYEGHINIEMTKDTGGHLWVTWGGHYTSTYPYKSMVSNMSINDASFNYVGIANWSTFTTIHNGTAGAYHIQTIIPLHFTTNTNNTAPTVSNPSPSDGATGLDLNPDLTFTVNDSDNDSMDIYVRTNASGSWQTLAYNTGQPSGTYTVTNNTVFNSYNTKYWWSVNVTDGTAWTNVTYTFTTRGAYEPATPSNFVASAYNCTSIVLNWTRGTNADKTVIVMNTSGYPSSVSDGTVVYNGTATDTWIWIDNLSYNTTYYFSAWGWNGSDSIYSSGYATANATTYAPPGKPSDPGPANGSTDVSRYATLSWNCTDLYNTSNLTYDVYLDTSNPPTQIVAHNISSTSYNPGALSYNTVYYWKIVAWNQYDGRNESEVWHFTTETTPPPNSIKNERLGTWYAYFHDAFNDSNMLDGDTLHVYSNYSAVETIHVNKSCKIAGHGAVINNTIYIEANNVNISSVQVNNYNIQVNSGMNNITFYNGTFYGIKAPNTVSNLTISFSSFYDTYSNDVYKIYIANGSNILVENCTFEFLYLANTVVLGGIVITGVNDTIHSHNIIFKNNTITNKNDTYIAYFLHIDNLVIVNNAFLNSTSKTVTISDCTNVSLNITKTSGRNIIGGPYIGGNYWNHYTGTDSDNDGIGDTPINISGYIDYLPLMPYDYPPTISNPNPANGSTNIPITTTLSVQINDTDGDNVNVTFYWSNGTVIGYDNVAGNGTANITVFNLNYNTTYTWYVTAYDGNKTVTSATWNFTTRAYNAPPSVRLLYPPAGWTSVEINPDLIFNITDDDSTYMWVEVYKSTDNSTWTLLSASNLTAGNYSVPLGDSSHNTKFYWKVCATNDNITWTNVTANFTTRELYEPAPPDPLNSDIYVYNSTAIEIYFIVGEASDKTVIVQKTSGYPASPSDGTVVYNGTDNATWVWITGLSPSTRYFYALYSWNSTGGFSDDAVLLNATTYNATSQPYNPTPANGSVNVSVTTTLSWSCDNPDSNGFTIDHYEVYFGTSNPPAFLANSSTTSYSLGTLAYATTYYWYVVAVNERGDKNASEVWQFTTTSSPPPEAPSNVSIGSYGYYWINLSWVKGSGATTTYIRYDTVNHTTWDRTTGYFLANTTDEFYLHSGLQKHTTYYYALWSYGDGGYSANYSTISFEIPNRVPTVSSASPTGNVTTPHNVTFSFYVSDPDNDLMYISLYLYEGGSWNNIKTWNGVGAGTYTYQYTPDDSTRNHKWHVTVTDNYDNIIAGDYYFNQNRLIDITNPFPADGATNVPINISQLSAYISDPDGDLFDWQIWIVTYVDGNGTQYGYSNNGSSETDGTKTCPITGNLEYGTTYTWYVNTTDGLDYSNRTFTFTTEYQNFPPEISNRLPLNGAGVHSPVTLSAYISDPENDVINVSFQYNNSGVWTEIYSWNNAASNQTFSYSWAVSNTIYYWRIVVDDGRNTNTSDVWSFTVTPTNTAPYAPSNPTPANESTGIALTVNLTWSCTDPEGDAITYNVYFGNTSTPSKVADNISHAWYVVDNLDFNTTYYWYIVAYDTGGLSNTSDLWHFTTRNNTSPSLSNPYPANNSTGVGFNPTLHIDVSDADSDAMNISIYIQSGSTWQLIAYYSGQHDGTYYAYPSGVTSYNTTYYWKVVATDEYNATTTAIYHFTTVSLGEGNITVEIKWESNGSYVGMDRLNGSFLVVYFTMDTEGYNITSNPMTGFNYTETPQLMRLFVNYGNTTIYRSLIPENTTSTVVFYIPGFNDTVGFYTFSLYDSSGEFPKETSTMQIYKYMNNQKVVINEDYFSVEGTSNAYLVFNQKYNLDVVNENSTYSGIIDADTTTTKLIQIPALYNVSATYSVFDVARVSFYLNNSTGNVVFAFSTTAGSTEWVNVSIYRIENGTDVLLYNGNYSSNTFNIMLSTDVNYTHYVTAKIMNTRFSDERTMTKYALPVSSNTRWNNYNNIMVVIFGDAGVSYILMGLSLFVILFMFVFGPKYAFLSMIAIGLFLLFVQVVIGFYAIQSIVAIIAVIFGAIEFIQHQEVKL